MARSETLQSRRLPMHPGSDAAPRTAGECGPVRKSKRGRWRAVSLIAVYLLAVAHFVHWKLNGLTLTPVEPSEAMQTLGEGLVNAGFVLFAILIVLTLIFGRFFCGWACHIVALQDLCTFLLRRMGLRPRPFRSRLLVYVPIAGAVWMFVLPSLVRLAMGSEHPNFRASFFTDNLWGRFPGIWIAGLTFAVCGFLIVYLLGNKGFCTYGCPYGGIFGLVDTIAPGKIRVSDACDGCGHCTATCTSNVRVHEEVKLYKMVVNPGCMKCLDCINVCPKDALSYGFGAPSVAKGAPRAKMPPRVYDFSMNEELTMAALFLVSVVILRALYDAVPFLLALGLASISAYTLLTVLRMVYVPNLRYSRYQLTVNGRATPAGKVFLAAGAVWTLFLVHSGFVQYATLEGARRVEAARGTTDGFEARAQSLQSGLDLLLQAEKFGLFPTGPLQARIGSASESLGDDAMAERHYRRAISIDEDLPVAHVALARYDRARGDKAGAIEELSAVMRLEPEYENAHADLAGLLLEENRGREAIELMDELLRRRPGLPSFRLTQALVLAQTGEVDRAIAETRAVAAAEPGLASAHYQLGRLLATQNQLEESLAALERASQLEPTSTELHGWCAKVAAALSQWNVARGHLESARREAPFDVGLARVWASLLHRAGELERVTADTERASSRDRAQRFALIYLYREAGRAREADLLAAEFPEASAH